MMFSPHTLLPLLTVTAALLSCSPSHAVKMWKGSSALERVAAITQQVTRSKLEVDALQDAVRANPDLQDNMSGALDEHNPIGKSMVQQLEDHIASQRPTSAGQEKGFYDVSQEVASYGDHASSGPRAPAALDKAWEESIGDMAFGDRLEQEELLYGAHDSEDQSMCGPAPLEAVSPRSPTPDKNIDDISMAPSVRKAWKQATYEQGVVPDEHMCGPASQGAVSRETNIDDAIPALADMSRQFQLSSTTVDFEVDASLSDAEIANHILKNTIEAE